MATVRPIGCCLTAWLVFGCLATAAYGQQPTPLADPVDRALFPAGISELPLTIAGQLANFFKDVDGTDVVHARGEVALSLGEPGGQEMKSREAVVWINHREHAGRPYLHLQVLLWGDAEVREMDHTTTSGPTLFVTLNTFGEIRTHVDDVAFESSAATPIYEQGNAIRRAVNEAASRGLDDAVSLRIFDPLSAGYAAPRAPSHSVISFRSDGQIKGPFPAGDQQALTIIGGVYLARGTPGADDYFEVRSDSAVVFLPLTEVSIEAGESPPPAGDEVRAQGSPIPPKPDGGEPTPRRGPRRSVDPQLMAMGLAEVEVEAVYLEGDVVMSQGPNMIRAERLYYDFVNDRALILDAVIRATLLERNVPIYVRAAEIRQLAANRLSAQGAVLTTSEFHTPHYHVGASRIELINRTPSGLSGGQTGIRAGSFRIEDATLNIVGRPIAYWPSIRGNLDTSETAIQSLRLGYSGDFGAELETRWQLFSLMGLETPKGFDAALSLDYFSERGPGIGVNVDYARDRYFGLIKSYLIHDDGEDFLGRSREESSSNGIRGRFLARHRQYLEDDWEVTLELSYISDKNFLEEFFKPEFNNGKEQETLLRLKKQRDNWAFTAMLQSRLLDFTTQTERLPDFGLFLVGEPIGERWTWFSENRWGIVRYRAADQTLREFLRDGPSRSSGSAARVDTRQEADAPLDLGPIRLVPFFAGRGSAWGETPRDGGVGRGFGAMGVRGSAYLSCVNPDIQSSMLDINGMRHIIKPDITAWISGSNRDSRDLYPFDESVEGIDELDGIALGLRQRWQTKRGQGENRRTVDVFTLDVEAGAFGGARTDETTNGYASFSRPEDSVARNFVSTSSIMRLNDRTALVTESNYDLNDADLDIYNLSLVVERPPRLSYLIGYRYIRDTDSNLLGADVNYQLTEKHTVAVRERFDLERGRTLDFTLAFIRRLPRWFTAISFQLDEAEDNFGVSFSLWPEGLPKAALGSRRFTGLATSGQLRGE